MARKPKNKSTIKNKNKIPVEKQKTPRHKEKYPALNPKRAVKTRQEQLEVPYLDQLNDKEKKFLNAFLEETVITNFQHKGKKIYKDRKPFYDANNARNRCMYTAAKASGALQSTATAEALSLLLDNYSDTADDVENALIRAIELKRSGSWENQD
jgi:hypothetical protein